MKLPQVFYYFYVSAAFWTLGTSERDHIGQKTGKIERIPEETETTFWYEKAQNTLRDKIKQPENRNRARNVIFFMGDGMSITTLTAARTYQSELTGRKFGEGNSLYFENFSHCGLAKTYCVDYKVSDSACTTTAYSGGVKGNQGTIGVNGKVTRRDCQAAMDPENHVESIVKWFQDAGRATGIVTNTRVTHASPAGLYAHIADRGWETDKDVSDSGEDDKLCDDIGEQLIFNKPGTNLHVIMGGGMGWFLPKEVGGKRKDGKNLMERWIKNRESDLNGTYRVVNTREELMQISEAPDYLLGLFADSHMDYQLEGNENQPRLFEMTEKAIKVLQKNENGFYLFVESGKIDLAHHGNKAHLALDETVELARAVETASLLTNSSDTLIIVTADHAHTMTLNGYPRRSDSIFGIGGTGDDKLPYATLSYANGPSYGTSALNHRINISKQKMNESMYRFPSAVPLKTETHGGDDVPVFAQGPWSHLFTGSYEQNYIPHALAYATCVGKGETLCGDSNNHIARKITN